MNLQQLESFIQVAENLSFARAAEVMNITQSAVSRQISSLENELGASLFHRSTRTVFPCARSRRASAARPAAGVSGP